MAISVVLPAGASIVTRGGPDQEAWGHPLERTAQYNHLTEGRKKPPVCPWRIEVGDSNPGTRTLFLHVFEILDKTDEPATEVTLLGASGVSLGGRHRVQFHGTGPLGGTIDGQPLTQEIHTEAQYANSAH